MRVPSRVQGCKVRPYPRTTSLARGAAGAGSSSNNVNFEDFTARRCGNADFRGASRVLRYAVPKDSAGQRGSPMHFARLGSGVAIVIGVASVSLLLSACGGTSGVPNSKRVRLDYFRVDFDVEL